MRLMERSGVWMSPSIPGSSSTKAPKGWRRTTLPVCRVPTAYFLQASQPGSGIAGALRESHTLPLSSIFMIFDLVGLAGLEDIARAVARGCGSSPGDGTSPSTPPTSTNAPNATTLLDDAVDDRRRP